MLCALQLFVVKTSSLVPVLRKSLEAVLAEQYTQRQRSPKCVNRSSVAQMLATGCGRTRHTFPKLVGIQPARHYREAARGHQGPREARVGCGAPAPGTHTAERGEQPQGPAQPSAALGAVSEEPHPASGSWKLTWRVTSLPDLLLSLFSKLETNHLLEKKNFP